jgi:hypothetical protein
MVKWTLAQPCREPCRAPLRRAWSAAGAAVPGDETLERGADAAAEGELAGFDLGDEPVNERVEFRSPQPRPQLTAHLEAELLELADALLLTDPLVHRLPPYTDRLLAIVGTQITPSRSFNLSPSLTAHEPTRWPWS